MTFFEHLEELKRRVVRAALAIAIGAIASFSLGYREATINGVWVPYPYPDVFNNFATILFDRIKTDLLPTYVEIIVTEPAQAFFALLSISIFLGILTAMPIIMYEALQFVMPGLYPHERRILFRLIVPSTVLFIAGAAFCYYTLLPFTFNFLYQYAQAFGARTFITVDTVIGFSLMFMAGVGLAFQLPLLMIGLTSVGVVDASFWKKNFRYAFIAMAIFGAIITPDGSGITMWFVTLPMTALYAGGYLVSLRYHRQPEGAASGSSYDEKP